MTEMDVPTSIVVAKRCRSIIDPIGQLPEFLKRLKRAYDSRPDAAGSKFQPIEPTAASESEVGK